LIEKTLASEYLGHGSMLILGGIPLGNISVMERADPIGNIYEALSFLKFWLPRKL
jgi:hypothetical protein